ncbi:MAG TPA: hypothetical protein VLW54_03045 [Candidatus Acidoferrales bacterium]|nr:hypothetical protein [Candidatus Acidoferrales bacterium]
MNVNWLSALRSTGYGVLIVTLAVAVPASAQDAPANGNSNSSATQSQNTNSQQGWKRFNGGWSKQPQASPAATAPAPSPTTARQIDPNAELNAEQNGNEANQQSSQNAPSNVPAVTPMNPPANDSANGAANSGTANGSDWQLTIPQGTYLTVRLNEPLSSDRNQTGDTFTATLAQPVIVNGVVVARRGQTVGGRVAEAKKAGRVSGVSHLKLELTGLTLVDGQFVPIQSQLVARNGGTSQGRDAAAIAGTTGFGAAVGAAASWGTGAAIGAGAGLVASTIGVLVTRGRPTILYPETRLTFQVSAPVTVDTERDPQAFHAATNSDYQPSQQTTASYQGPSADCGPYGCPPPYPYPYYAYYGPYYPYPYYWAPGFTFFYGPRFYGGFHGRFRGGFRR